MTTDDAPRPALDAASFRALVDTLLDWHSAMSHAAFDGDAARTNACYARTYARMRDAYQRVLAAGRRADALAGRIERALVLLGGVELRMSDALEMVEAGDDEEEEWWADTLAQLRDGMAALAPAAGEGMGDGARD